MCKHADSGDRLVPVESMERIQRQQQLFGMDFKPVIRYRISLLLGWLWRSHCGGYCKCECKQIYFICPRISGCQSIVRRKCVPQKEDSGEGLFLKKIL